MPPVLTGGYLLSRGEAASLLQINSCVFVVQTLWEKPAQHGVILETFGVFLDNFGVVWEQFGVILDKLGVTNAPEIVVFSSKTKNIAILHQKTGAIS